MDNRNKICYNALKEVFSSGAYSNVCLNKALRETRESERNYVTRLFYGVLDKNVYLEYKISKLTDKKPKTSVAIIIKMGLYLLEFSNTPAYAVTSEMLKLAELVGKGQLKGLINAVLRNSANVELPADNVERISVEYSYPLWLTQLLILERGEEFTREFYGAKLNDNTHVRPALNKISIEEFEKKYPEITSKRTEFGYYVTHNTLKSLNKGDYEVQSLASCIAVNAYFDALSRVPIVLTDYPKILDLCASPGGKSVYLKTMAPHATVYACDVHEHRVDLIKSHARESGVELNILKNDATIFNSEWDSKFEMVVCDVPCSGIGVIGSKPDIMLNRTADDVKQLAKLQYDILSTAKKYVKIGGALCYSTCTILLDENERQIEKFLSENDNYEILPISVGERMCQRDIFLLPQTDYTDGFYICALRRVK